MDFALQGTPQRPLPGAFMMTPAVNRQQSGQPLPRPPAFRAQPSAASQGVVSQPQGQVASGAQSGAITSSSSAQTLTAIERADRTINEALAQEKRYPELGSYLTQGISSDYDIPTSMAWAPFQKVKTYDIPDRIFEQYNQAQVSTMMGLFAEINHAWITIDNALYLWDYTHPNPELIGFEEQPNSITAVKLVVPRAKVFVETIKYLLVVATTSDIFLVGVSCTTSDAGVKTVALYQTRMQVSIKGIDVSCVEGSDRTGRIFFGGRGTDDVYELTYQQEEKWFANRCGKINHTSKGIASVLPALPFGHTKPHEHVIQMAVDDTRALLYTLSSTSTIRVFHLRAADSLDLAITRPFSSLRTNIGHMVSRSDLFQPNTTIVSISPITATEATRLNLMATTSTGCRLFLSATSGTYYASTASSVPTSMQVHHVKFPPGNSGAPQATPPQGSSSQTQMTPYQGGPTIDTNSKSLSLTRSAVRYPPGYFFCFVQRSREAGNDTLFVSAPDTGRIAQPHDPSQVTRFAEMGLWLPLSSRAEDIGRITPPFAASSEPAGFGNDLATQFDQPASEFAILTNTGVQTVRRRRLVDIFAAAIRYGGGDDGLEESVRKFVRRYGRGETSATALAVACGQGSDVTPDARVANITDPDVVEYARKAFIEHGGRPTLNENNMLDQSASAIDNVRPSPRHEGIALYISRLVRSLWRTPILREEITPMGGLTVTPGVPLAKLQAVQRHLTNLQEFLEANKSFIGGLAGPEALNRVGTKQEEVALQGEHRALNSLVKLIANIIEGISFVCMLFDERVDEIMLSLPDTSRQKVRQLTFEGLFCSKEGRDLAKELVKAIVNRNIANGSNVDTVAEALRRRCGSFCSADDVVIFKAQEQLKRASQAGANSETGRMLLNESLKLFEKVAGSLSMENLQAAVEQYISLAFCAGAIRLALRVAQQLDRGNRALAWIKDGSPDQDVRKEAFENRTRCYGLIHRIILAVDQASSQTPETVDGQYTLTARRKQEAYDEINNSDDEVFQTNLYDWYIGQGWSDRLLDISSPYVVSYLQRKALDDPAYADLLWRYYAHYHNYFEAATVQLQLAKSGFDLSLEARIEYLSRAKANASTRTTGLSDMGRSRQSRQGLLREITDLLDIATVQEDILQRVKSDPRLTPEHAPEVLKGLNGKILSVNELFNDYADQAGYYDVCLYIYQVADHRNPTDIRATWNNLFEQLHKETQEAGEVQPYEVISERLRSIGTRLHLDEMIFPIPMLLPMLLTYAHNYLRATGPAHWVLDTFLDIGAPYEVLLSTLEALFFNQEPPFSGRNRRLVAHEMVYVIQRWWEDSARGGGLVFGGEENAVAVAESLRVLLEQDVLEEPGVLEEARVLRGRVEQVLR